MGINLSIVCNSFKGTGRLNQETDVLILSQHDHNIEAYKSDVYDLKTKCRITARRTQTNISFDTTTRNDPSACEVTFVECESAMYRVRRKLQPKSPLETVEFCEMLSTISFGKYYQGSFGEMWY